MSQLTKYIILFVVAAGAGSAVTKYYWPTTKNVGTEVVRNNIITQVREVVRQDGTKEIVTVVTDTSTKKSKEVKTEVAKKPQWHATLSASCPIGDLRCTKTVYGAQLDYNFAGPFTIGVRADTENQVGITFGVSF